MSEHDEDLFDDSVANTEEAETEDEEQSEDTEDAEDGDESETEDDSEEEEGDEEEDTSDEGEENDEETPASEEDPKNTKAEKLIPESRLKAAVKDVTEERDRLRAELEQKNAKPAPDPNVDPEGAELHDRIEISKAMCRDVYSDYDEKAKYFNDVMLPANPALANAVAAHRTPAKLAYDLAKKAMEIDEITKVKDSPEWKAFQEFKKNGGKTVGDRLTEGAKKKTVSAANKVPNLNKKASANPNRGKQSDEDDSLFDDAVIDGNRKKG